MANRHERRRRQAVIDATPKHKYDGIHSGSVLCEYEPIPSFRKLDRETRRSFVELLYGIAGKYHDTGVCVWMPKWRLAATFYGLLRQGAARLEEDDAGKIWLKMPREIKLEWKH